MLLPADADLSHRDTALPGLRLALDASRVAERIAALSGQPVNSCRAEYVRYKPGTSCVVGMTLEAPGQQIRLHVTAYRPQDAAKRQKAHESSMAHSAFGPASLELGDHCLATFFPNDATVRSLQKLAAAESRHELLSRLFTDPSFTDSSWSMLAYKPERRAVVRLDVDDRPRAVLKLYGVDRFETARRNAKVARSGEVLRVPQRMGKSASNNAIAIEWLAGTELTCVLRGSLGRISGALHRVAGALRELHCQPIADLAAGNTLAHAIAAVGRTIGVLHPTAAKRADRLARALAGDLGDPPAAPLTIHGDFYTKQVLLHQEQVAIVDLDDLRAGPAEQDLGNFLAHLDVDVDLARIDTVTAQAAAAELIDGYRRAGGEISSERVRLHRAAGLFRLAVKPFRDRLDDWPQRIDRLLDATSAVLESRAEVTA